MKLTGKVSKPVKRTNKEYYDKKRNKKEARQYQTLIERSTSK
jgi:hypothetical protein